MKPDIQKKAALACWLIFAMLIGGLLTPVAAAAQTPTPTPAPVVDAVGIEMDAYPAFDGYFKYGEWLPIWIEVANTGADVNAEVRIAVSGASAMEFTAPVELPGGSRKRLPLFVLPNNFSRRLIVELVSGDTLLASRPVDISPQPTITFLVGLIAPERGALTAIDDIRIPGSRRPIEMVDAALADLPDKYEGLRSFDLLVIANTDTSGLTSDQSRALESWVRQGGRLVVGGGADAAGVAAGLPKTLLPLSDITTEPVSDLPGLEEFVADALTQASYPILVPGPFVAALGDADGGKLLATQPGLDLVIEWPLEGGWVNWVAVDIAGSPFDAWNGTVPFWQRLAAASAVFPEFAPPDMSARQQFASALTYPLSNLPMLDLPSVTSLALLLGLYILLVGPVNYLVLRRRNQLHLAWITIPLLTVVFSVAAFALGYTLRGTDVFVNKIAVMILDPSGRARVDSFIGLFSPAQRAYEVKIFDGGLVSPLSPYYDPWSGISQAGGLPTGQRIRLVQGNPASVSGLSVEQWSMQSFMSEGVYVDFGVISADLRLEGERMVGEIHNQSASTLVDATLIYGPRFAHLGELPAGGSVQVDMALTEQSGSTQMFGQPVSYAIYETQLSGVNGPAPREIEVRRSVVEAIFDRNPPIIPSSNSSGGQAVATHRPTLIGWIDQAPPEVQVIGADPGRQTTGIVLTTFDFSLPAAGAISLPPGMVPGRMIEAPSEGGSCGPTGSTAIYIARGEAIFEFILPEGISPEDVETLKVNLNTDGGFFNPPTIAIYDWDQSQWLDLEGMAQGLNLVPASPNLIGDLGAVRIRLGGENLQYCYYVEVGLEAVR